MSPPTVSSWSTYEEEDYPSSSDEARNDRVRRNRTRHTDRNLERIRTAVTGSASQSRAFAAALSTIREDALVKAQFERIEQIWTLQRDRTLADVLFTEVTLAILQAANAVVSAGKNVGDEDEEAFAARHAARTRTLGDYQWVERGASSADSSSMATPQREETRFDLEVVKARLN